MKERILAACVGGLVTFSAMYMLVVGRFVSRTEVSLMIQAESPYVRDAKWIENELQRINTKLDTLLKR